MDLILNYNELNINKIKFVEPLNNLIMGNGLHINLKYKLLDLDLNEIILETPVMEAPFGIRKYDESDNKNKNKFYIDLSFKDIEEMYINQIRYNYKADEGR